MSSDGVLKEQTAKKELALLRSQVELLHKENAELRARVDQSGARDKAAVVQDALVSFKQLLDNGFISEKEFQHRRTDLLDKLACIDEEDDVTKREDYDPLFLAEELRLGGNVMWLTMPRKNLQKYPFGKPFAKPLIDGLVPTKEQVPKGINLTPVHFVEIAHDNQARLLGFNRHFFIIVDKDSLEILNVYRYDQMKRWIFQTFLTVDFGKYESKFFLFRMEIDKARCIQKLLLKYIDLATTEKAQNPPSDTKQSEEAFEPDAPASWFQSFWS